MIFTTRDKIAELRRELALRIRVYPEFIRNGKLSTRDAKHQTGILRAIIEDYERLIGIGPQPGLFGPALEGGDHSEADRGEST